MGCWRKRPRRIRLPVGLPRLGVRSAVGSLPFTAGYRVLEPSDRADLWGSSGGVRFSPARIAQARLNSSISQPPPNTADPLGCLRNAQKGEVLTPQPCRRHRGNLRPLQLCCRSYRETACNVNCQLSLACYVFRQRSEESAHSSSKLSQRAELPSGRPAPALGSESRPSLPSQQVWSVHAGRLTRCRSNTSSARICRVKV